MSSRIETDVFWLRYRRLMMVVYILCLQPEFGVLSEKLVFPLRGVVFLVAAERIRNQCAVHTVAMPIVGSMR